MSTAVAYAPNRYHRVKMNTVSLIYAHTKPLVGASLKGYSLHCIIFRTTTDPACGSGGMFVQSARFVEKVNRLPNMVAPYLLYQTYVRKSTYIKKINFYLYKNRKDSLNE